MKAFSVAVLFAAALSAAPASAQIAGSGGIGGAGGSGGGVSSPGGSASGTGSVGGGQAYSTPELRSPGSGLGSGSTPAGGGISGNGLGGSSGAGSLGTASGSGGAGAATTEQRASEGSTTINPLNAGSIARGGSTAGVVSFGSGLSSSSLPPSISGAGPERLFDIPQPRVAVDLGAIRSALAAGPSATPKPDGR